MGQAIGAVLPLGVGVALSPLPIVAVVLMLGGTRGRSNGPAFLAGWLLGLAVVGTVVLLVAGALGPGDDGEPADWVSWVKLALGVLVLLLALRTWRTRPSDDGGLPGWMSALDSWTAGKAFGLGAALSAANPKNLMLTIAAAAAIAQTGASAGSQAVALAVFVVIGGLGPGLPVVIDLVMGARAARLLAQLKSWLARHNAAVLTVVLLVIGAKLIGDAVAGLSA
ncbi:GAP family protein [Jiangella mangrovi]|uniref:Threonine/homoserine/homoserine lactone efflux protein n=1 Tax=Jiangella mangrovi TaxID=1524084 RepID=A0A7W9LM82_9ACTN|nr:GAP family protein [Jiangella mangrovi]MBB5788981.1 threonine/homoserine/homoserine lactone efflux protein [Jiangella mangrovi]